MSVAGIPTPEKSMIVDQKPTDGFGAPWYCSTSPMPRSWKSGVAKCRRPDIRSGIKASTSSKCWTPAYRSVSSSSTVTLCGSSAMLVACRLAVTTISCSVPSSANASGDDANESASAIHATALSFQCTCSLRRYGNRIKVQRVRRFTDVSGPTRTTPRFVHRFCLRCAERQKRCKQDYFLHSTQSLFILVIAQ